MSVAFRRESDEEHLEPKFEIPIPAGPNLVTPRGLALIEARVAALEAEAAEQSDPIALAVSKRDLRYWHTRRITAVVAPPPPADCIAFGSRVRIAQAGVERSIQIVGADEADPAAGLIAFDAPLARALIGAEVEEEIAFGPGSATISVVAIETP